MDHILDRTKRLLSKREPAGEARSFSPGVNVFKEIHGEEVKAKEYEPPARLREVAGENEFRIEDIDHELYEPATFDLSANLEPPQPHEKPSKHFPLSEEMGGGGEQPLRNLKEVSKLRINIETLSIAHAKLARALKL